MARSMNRTMRMAVGLMPQAQARDTIDATGLIVAPGFIDMLGHSEYPLLTNPQAASKITQGITTEITGEVTSVVPVNANTLRELGDSTRMLVTWTDDPPIRVRISSPSAEAVKSMKATVDGTIYGSRVPNAGAISWLVNNIGPMASTAVQEDARIAGRALVRAVRALRAGELEAERSTQPKPRPK